MIITRRTALRLVAQGKAFYVTEKDSRDVLHNDEHYTIVNRTDKNQTCHYLTE
jgi:hypothetical protein